MTGLDRSAAAAVAPPLPAADPATLTAPVLTETARLVLDRTIRMGLTEWFWGEGIALLGMIRLADALGEPIPDFVSDFVRGHHRDGITVEHVNNLAPGAANARLLADTGDPAYREINAQLLAWLDGGERLTVAENGAIEHWPGGVWADTVCMAGLFLIHCGRATGEARPLLTAGRQIVAHTEILCDPDTGLYAHGSHRGETMWWFWGRANAWTALAAVEFLEAVGDRAADSDGDRDSDSDSGDGELVELAGRIRVSLTRQLVALVDRQPSYGVWDVLVDGQPENRGIVETSAAAGIAAAMLRAARLGIEPDLLRTAGWRAVAGVHPYVAPDGTLTRTSAGTVLQLIPFGYSVIRDDLIQPWGQGLALHAYAAAIEDRRRTTTITREG